MVNTTFSDRLEKHNGNLCTVRFLSYRRDDSGDAVNWLYEKLDQKFGANILFMDTGSIEPADSWDDKILKKLEESEIVLVVIANEWLIKGIDEFGRRRIDKENDWVRMEIKTALNRSKMVYPILIDGAKMPPPDALPDPIKRLSNHQAYEVNVNAGSNSGIEGLFNLLNNTLTKQYAG